MRRFELRHRFEGDPARFWEGALFDEALNRKLHLEDLGMRGYSLEHTPGMPIPSRVVRVTFDAPAALRPLMGETITYVERGALESNVYRYTLALETSQSSTVRGESRLVDVDTRGFSRVTSIAVEVRLFGIGGRIEAGIEKALRDGYDRGAPLLARALAARVTIERP